MKIKQFAQITPHRFEGKLILSLDEKWIEVCDDILTFAVIINKENRLVLVGPKLSGVYGGIVCGGEKT